MEDISLDESKINVINQNFNKFKVTYQRLLDQSTPHDKYRWLSFGFLLAVFLARIVFSQGWYIVCYGLSIYLLNLFLAFLQPKLDMTIEQTEQYENMEAGEMSEEFRPFIRRLPEFKFWHRATVATVLSLFLSLFPFTDVPVFWPILLIYFIILFTLTMRRQIQHMIKYRYLPFDFGKKKYGSK